MSAVDENRLQIALPLDAADAIESAVQFWHASLKRFAETATSGDLRIFFEEEAKAELRRLITALRPPDYVAKWKNTLGSLMVTLPDVDRALTRNRVLLANARAQALTSERINRRRDAGLLRAH